MNILLLLLISIGNLMFFYDNEGSIEDYAFYLPLFSIVISILSILPKITGNRIEMKVLYVFFAGIFFFQTPMYFDALSNPEFIRSTLYFYRINEIYFVKANYLLGVSLPLIVVGYLIKAKKTKKPSTKKYEKIDKREILVFSILALVFLQLSVIVTGFTVGSTYYGTSSYSYVLLYRMIYLLASILIYYNVVCHQEANKDFIKKGFDLPNIVFIAFTIYVLVGGDRGPVFTLINIIFLGYLLKNNMSIKLKNSIILVVVAILVYYTFSFVEVIRVYISDQTLSKETLAEGLSAYEEHNTSINGLQIRTTALAIEGIENNLYPHTYGFIALQGLIKGLPFIGNMINNNLFGNNIYANGSEYLLTVQYYGFNPTSGIGTTYLADVFIEFGIIGVICSSILYGILIAHIENRIYNKTFKSFLSFLLVVYFFAFLFSVGRANLLRFLVHFIHSVSFYLLIKYLIINPFKRIKFSTS